MHLRKRRLGRGWGAGHRASTRPGPLPSGGPRLFRSPKPSEAPFGLFTKAVLSAPHPDPEAFTGSRFGLPPRPPGHYCHLGLMASRLSQQHYLPNNKAVVACEDFPGS